MAILPTILFGSESRSFLISDESGHGYFENPMLVAKPAKSTSKLPGQIRRTIRGTNGQMGSYTAVVKIGEAETPLRVVDTSVTLCLTHEEAHEIFERVLHSNVDDTAASVQALKKLAAAIGASV
jgi:hypothetical protein